MVGFKKKIKMLSLQDTHIIVVYIAETTQDKFKEKEEYKYVSFYILQLLNIIELTV